MHQEKSLQFWLQSLLQKLNHFGISQFCTHPKRGFPSFQSTLLIRWFVDVDPWKLCQMWSGDMPGGRRNLRTVMVKQLDWSPPEQVMVPSSSRTISIETYGDDWGSPIIRHSYMFLLNIATRCLQTAGTNNQTYLPGQCICNSISAVCSLSAWNSVPGCITVPPRQAGFSWFWLVMWIYSMNFHDRTNSVRSPGQQPQSRWKTETSLLGLLCSSTLASPAPGIASHCPYSPTHPTSQQSYNKLLLITDWQGRHRPKYRWRCSLFGVSLSSSQAKTDNMLRAYWWSYENEKVESLQRAWCHVSAHPQGCTWVQTCRNPRDGRS